jgi:hypothetical protein
MSLSDASSAITRSLSSPLPLRAHRRKTRLYETLTRQFGETLRCDKQDLYLCIFDDKHFLFLFLMESIFTFSYDKE